jgi:aminoglycoside phosphotransferase (APT) family kinase protein
VSPATTQEHRALIERLFPALAIRTFEPIGDGWTSFTYVANDEWIVQLPRNAYATERLRVQASVLPELAGELSALVPAPEFVSSEPAAIAYRRLDGITADEAPDGLWPERFGRFLYDLHMVPPEYVGMRGTVASAVRAAERDSWTQLRAEIADAVGVAERAVLDAEVGALLDDDDLWVFAPCLTHNDLGPEHLLVRPDGDLVGVLDWEEVGVGDPANDFAWWLHEMPGVGERALAAYGGASDRRFRERARLRWAMMPWHDVHHWVRMGRDDLVDDGLAAVRRRRP